MSIRRLPPHLVSDGDNKRCSACEEVFAVDGGISLSRKFAQHVRTQHKPQPKSDEKEEKQTIGEPKAK